MIFSAGGHEGPQQLGRLLHAGEQKGALHCRQAPQGARFGPCGGLPGISKERSENGLPTHKSRLPNGLKARLLASGL